MKATPTPLLTLFAIITGAFLLPGTSLADRTDPAASIKGSTTNRTGAANEKPDFKRTTYEIRGGGFLDVNQAFDGSDAALKNLAFLNSLKDAWSAPIPNGAGTMSGRIAAEHIEYAIFNQPVLIDKGSWRTHLKSIIREPKGTFAFTMTVVYSHNFFDEGPPRGHGDFYHISEVSMTFHAVAGQEKPAPEEKPDPDAEPEPDAKK